MFKCRFKYFSLLRFFIFEYDKIFENFETLFLAEPVSWHCPRTRNQGERIWIWKNPNWTCFRFDSSISSQEQNFRVSWTNFDLDRPGSTVCWVKTVSVQLRMKRDYFRIICNFLFTVRVNYTDNYGVRTNSLFLMTSWRHKIFWGYFW